MTPPPAVTDEELAEVERLDREATAGEWRTDTTWHGGGSIIAPNPEQGEGEDGYQLGGFLIAGEPPEEDEHSEGTSPDNWTADAALIARFRTLAPRLVSEVRIGRLWKALALALIATRARGNAPEVLRAIAELEQQGEHVPAVVRL